MSETRQRKPVVKGSSGERRRYAQYENRREAIVNGAAALFVERGYEAATLISLAHKLKIRKSTVYYYFDSKESILLEIIDRAQKQISEAVEASHHGDGNGMARLRTFCRRYAVMVTTTNGQCLIKLNWQKGDKLFGDEVWRRILAIDRMVARLIEQGKADGSIAIIDTRMAERIIFGALNWVAFWYQPTGALDAEDVAENLVDTMLLGLLPR